MGPAARPMCRSKTGPHLASKLVNALLRWRAAATASCLLVFVASAFLQPLPVPPPQVRLGMEHPVPDPVPLDRRPMSFGLDAYSLHTQAGLGAVADYGTLWIGAWIEQSGWVIPEARLAAMRDAGVTPAIHLYYWGDDISRACFEDGCWSTLHHTWKDQAGWWNVTRALLLRLDVLEGRTVLILLETEFNKADIPGYEPFDEALAKMATWIHAQYPAARIVLPLGAWNPSAWGTWDRAAAASDSIGIQGMRASTQDTAARYDDLFNTTLEAARTAHALFGKPVVLHDVALSSHPEPDYLERQERGMQAVFDGVDELKGAGVRAVLYRSWRDAENMDVANHFGVAETGWGLAWSDDVAKPAGVVWMAGVQAERTAPQAPAFAPNVFEVEAFLVRSAGGLEEDVSASGGTAWNLWSNGSVSTPLTLKPGPQELLIRARGTPFQEVWPRMEVFVGGQRVLQVDTGPSFESHRALIDQEGPTELRIRFANDQAGTNEDGLWEDRNLILDHVRVQEVQRLQDKPPIEVRADRESCSAASSKTCPYPDESR